MIYEFCAENVTLLEKAMQAGARRIELCDNLAVGGTTPSYGVTKAAVELAANYDTTIMTMIRPRGGDFVYNDLEITIMLEDIRLTAQAGSQGVVFGALTADKKLDKPNLEKLITASKGMEIVFHMAFDELSDEDQLEAIDWLNQFATDGLKPDLTLYFDIEVEEGLARIAANSNREVNRLDLEGLDLHKKVRQGYLSLLEKEGDRIAKIDASLPLDQVVEDTKSVLFERMGLSK